MEGRSRVGHETFSSQLYVSQPHYLRHIATLFCASPHFIAASTLRVEDWRRSRGAQYWGEISPYCAAYTPQPTPFCYKRVLRLARKKAGEKWATFDGSLYPPQNGETMTTIWTIYSEGEESLAVVKTNGQFGEFEKAITQSFVDQFVEHLSYEISS